MKNMVATVATMSSKGQLVLPRIIRESLNLGKGSAFHLILNEDSILLRPIMPPQKAEVMRMCMEAREWANEVGLTEADIAEEIKTYRAERQSRAHCR